MTDENVMYMRPETCGGIYLNYKNTVDSLHPKLPFGMAQIGKAFRNEIVAKQFVFRTREFEQMEMQYFFGPKSGGENWNESTKNIFEKWHQTRWAFYLEYGLKAENLNWYKHEKLAHYASDAYDIEYKYKMLGGFKELEGVHARGDWDLSQHSKFSGIDLSYFDEATRERYTPHIVETSVGVARLMLAFIDDAYTTEDLSKEIVDENGEKKIKQDSRVVMRLDKRLSPIKVAILPLSKKEPLQNAARDIWKTLNKKWMCEYDESGSVGKRYRRQDEIGTPYCVTIDFESVQEKNEDGTDNKNFNTVTVRDRDSMEQERVNVSDIKNYFVNKFAF
jgi:glycyl-tRNA synthetase